MRTRVDYERHGRTYSQHRRADPRIAARIHAALGDARTVLNVGAGPEELLDPKVRSAQSVWALLEPGVEQRIVERLATALDSGAWDAEHGYLREQQELRGALRLVISEDPP